MGARKAVQFTPERREVFLEAVRQGKPNHLAAAEAGVTFSLATDWITTGRSPTSKRTLRRRKPDWIAEAVRFVEAYERASEVGQLRQQEIALNGILDAGLGGDSRVKKVVIRRPAYSYDDEGNKTPILGPDGKPELHVVEERVEHDKADPKALEALLRLRWPEIYANRARLDVTTRQDLTADEIKRLQELMKSGALAPDEVQGLRGGDNNIALGREILARFEGAVE